MHTSDRDSSFRPRDEAHARKFLIWMKNPCWLFRAASGYLFWARKMKILVDFVVWHEKICFPMIRWAMSADALGQLFFSLRLPSIALCSYLL